MATRNRSIAASVLFTLFGGPGILLVLIPWLITRFHLPAAQPLSQILLAILLIVLGLIPLFESILRFIRVGRGSLVPSVPTERLVVTGFYRFVRNPMYIGVLIVLGAEALLFQSVDLFAELLVAALLMHLFIRFYEEPRLIRTFGDEYLRFRHNVPRWLPRLTPWRP